MLEKRRANRTWMDDSSVGKYTHIKIVNRRSNFTLNGSKNITDNWCDNGLNKVD